jgi:hypothetical protein
MLFIFTVFLSSSCTTVKTTDPARAATEQLLLSTATDHALQSSDLTVFANQKVFLDTTYFDSYDPKYAIGTIRDALSRAGAILEDNAAASDIIVEARSGALSIDSSDSLFGIPSLGLPIPLAGTIQTPELAFYKSHQQNSFAKIALLAFGKQSRAHIYSSGPLDGISYDKHYNFLFISWVRSDLPEKQKTKEKTVQYQTWFPQFDLANLPDTNAPATNQPPQKNLPVNLPATNAPSAIPVSTNAPSLTPLNTNTAEL